MHVCTLVQIMHGASPLCCQKPTLEMDYAYWLRALKKHLSITFDTCCIKTTSKDRNRPTRNPVKAPLPDYCCESDTPYQINPKLTYGNEQGINRQYRFFAKKYAKSRFRNNPDLWMFTIFVPKIG